MAPATPRKTTVQSVTRTLDLLEALSAPGDFGLVELSKQAGLSPSTTHRLLATLVERRYAVRSATTGRYALGYKVTELGDVVSARTGELRAAARPHLERIQKVTRESANLTVLEPPNIVYVDQVEGTHSVRMFARLGAAVPAHATAAGKAMLAHMKAGTADEIWHGSLPELTPRTITTIDDLERELDRVRKRGYALDHEEQEAGVSCVAAAVLGEEGVVAALSVSAPTQRVQDSGPADLGELIVDCAERMSAELG
jgi:DNA-binding IclR family transcriptional regulator